MKHKTPCPPALLSRTDMKNIKGGWIPEYTLWTCSNYAYPYKVVGYELTNPDTTCAGVGTCTLFSSTLDFNKECEVVNPF